VARGLDLTTFKKLSNLADTRNGCIFKSIIFPKKRAEYCKYILQSHSEKLTELTKVRNKTFATLSTQCVDNCVIRFDKSYELSNLPVGLKN
jgi:hypothetical protein